MRLFSYPRTGLLLAVLASALMSACSAEKSADPAPTPAVLHAVEVRYATTNTAGLGAVVEVKDQRNYGPVAVCATATPAPSDSASLTLGTYDLGASVEVGLTFTNVTRGGPVAVPPGASLRAVIYVDGVPKARAVLSNTSGEFTNYSGSRSTPALQARAAVEFD